MAILTEMDPDISLLSQLQQKATPIVLINKINVDPEEIKDFFKAWTLDAGFMKRQPGFISTQLYRGIGGSAVFINHAVWESVEYFKQAFSQNEFREHLRHYPKNTVFSPHLFTKIAVPGICVT